MLLSNRSNIISNWKYLVYCYKNYDVTISVKYYWIIDKCINFIIHSSYIKNHVVLNDINNKLRKSNIYIINSTDYNISKVLNMIPKYIHFLFVNHGVVRLHVLYLFLGISTMKHGLTPDIIDVIDNLRS